MDKASEDNASFVQRKDSRLSKNPVEISSEFCEAVGEMLKEPRYVSQRDELMAAIMCNFYGTNRSKSPQCIELRKHLKFRKAPLSKLCKT